MILCAFVSLWHKAIRSMDTSKWWIYYSDVFGIGMLIIAITGMFIERGKIVFRQEGGSLHLLELFSADLSFYNRLTRKSLAK